MKERLKELLLRKKILYNSLTNHQDGSYVKRKNNSNQPEYLAY